MNNLHIETLDLNLLRVLSALLEERSVTRAGARLNVTQSAVSHALGRLRFALGDPLLVRGPNGMQPTARGAEIAAALPAALANVYGALALAPFEPANSTRSFVLVSGSYSCAVLMPPLMRRLSKTAPLVRVEIRTYSSDMIEKLDRGETDMIVGGVTTAPPRFLFEPLLEEEIVWVAREGNPISRAPLTIEALARAKHVVIDNPNSTFVPRERANAPDASNWMDEGAFAAEAQSRGLGVDIALVVPDTYSALAMVSQSDMVALAPRRLALMRAPAEPLAILAPPYTIAPKTLGIIVRPDHAQNPALAWFRGELAQAAAQIA